MAPVGNEALHVEYEKNSKATFAFPLELITRMFDSTCYQNSDTHGAHELLLLIAKASMHTLMLVETSYLWTLIAYTHSHTRTEHILTRRPAAVPVASVTS